MIPLKMDKEVKKLWIDALRSGKYKKGKFRLNENNEKFCCLGVLCEIAIENKIDINKKKIDGSYVYDCEDLVLPVSVVKWAGLTERDTFISGSTLSSLNDLKNNYYTFSRIADIIEKYL